VAATTIDDLDAIADVTSPAQQSRIPTTLPIKVISGMRDSVGGDTRRVMKLLDA